MNTLYNNRWLIVSAVNFLLLFFVTQINHFAAPIGIHLFVLGMIVSFSAMELNLKQGLLSLVPIALFIDSKNPFPFGFTLFLCIVLFTLTHILRSRIRREISASGLASSIFLNLFAFVANSFQAARLFGSETIHLDSLFINLCLSTIFVIFCNKTYFQFQIGTLSLFGIRLAEEQREAR